MAAIVLFCLALLVCIVLRTNILYALGHDERNCYKTIAAIPILPILFNTVSLS